ncbi:uncharacterized protein LOC116412979 [Galleria mellonella]|uniref:Uncharacterized protein LOC116412979 n=1 Tax=Galleria mellonella TaxID=7137 RepID=A0A6J3C2X6_GALME|nr:uncharacterized protein LOC116412979 [Galleria mellonella]
MFRIVTLLLFFITAFAHNNKLQYDADLQSALLPQELNPAFVPEKAAQHNIPWKTLLPMRYRRSYIPLEQPSSIQIVKKYSRIATCVVLVISIIVEIVLYVLEIYYVL